MNAREKVLEDLKVSSETWNLLPVEDSADEVLSIGSTHDGIVKYCLIRGMETIEGHSANAEIFLPQVLAVLRVVEDAQFILEQFILKEKSIHEDTVAINTVREGVHKIGKDLCSTISCWSSYKVIDSDAIRWQGHIDTISDIDSGIFSCSTLVIRILTIQDEVVKVVYNKNMLIAMIFGGSPCSQERVNNVGGNGYLLLFVEMVILVFGLYTRRNKNMAVRHLDLDIWGSYHHLSNIMVLCSSVGQNGS